MAKAAKKSITPRDDAELLDMAKRFHRSWTRWGKLPEYDERTAHLSDVCGELEPRIIATPVYTQAGLAAKLRLLKTTQYAGREGRPESAVGDVAELVKAILALDAARIAAAT